MKQNITLEYLESLPTLYLFYAMQSKSLIEIHVKKIKPLYISRGKHDICIEYKLKYRSLRGTFSCGYRYLNKPFLTCDSDVINLALAISPKVALGLIRDRLLHFGASIHKIKQIQREVINDLRLGKDSSFKEVEAKPLKRWVIKNDNWGLSFKTMDYWDDDWDLPF